LARASFYFIIALYGLEHTKRKPGPVCGSVLLAALAFFA